MAVCDSAPVWEAPPELGVRGCVLSIPSARKTRFCPPLFMLAPEEEVVGVHVVGRAAEGGRGIGGAMDARSGAERCCEGCAPP